MQRKQSLGKPDQKDLNENLAATQGLAHMIAECKKLFQVRHWNVLFLVKDLVNRTKSWTSAPIKEYGLLILHSPGPSLISGTAYGPSAPGVSLVHLPSFFVTCVPHRSLRRWADVGTPTLNKKWSPSLWKHWGASTVTNPRTITTSSRTAWMACSKRLKRSLKAGSATQLRNRLNSPIKR